MPRQRQSGQGMTEYIIIVGLIAVALIVAVAYFGQRSKKTFAKSGTALAGTEADGGGHEGATATPRTTTGKPGSAGQTGSGTSAGTGPGRGGDAPATPGVVAGSGGGKLSTDFKKAPRPDPYLVEDDSPWKVVEIPEEADTDALAAFAGKVDSRRGSGQGASSAGASSSGFPLGIVILILLVAVGGAFVMTMLIKKG